MAEPRLPLIVEPADLEPALNRDGILVIDLSDPPAYAQGHLPGAVNLPYSYLVRAEPPVMGLMAEEAQLSQVLSAVGLTPDTHVVAYDREGNGRASRLLWTLDVLGHEHFSLLDGGLAAWAAEQRPIEAGNVDPKPSQYQAEIRKPEALADREYILEHLKDPSVVVLDARSAPEYAGQDRRAARAGHIPGAVNLDWTATMDPARERRLLPQEQLEQLLKDRGVTPDKEVIVHCQTHHRSAHSYVMLKSLGYEKVRGYAGSWSEWGNLPDTPVEED